MHTYAGAQPTPLVIADQGHFWVGIKRTQRPHG